MTAIAAVELRTLRDVMRVIDHTMVRPDLTRAEVEEGVVRAVEVGTATAIVRPWEVRSASRLVTGSTTRIGTSIGFPHGGHATAVKVREAAVAVADGAGEVDVVMNVGAFLSDDLAYVAAELRAVVEAAHPAVVKVIIESGYLPPDRIPEAAALVVDAGADFVKNGTGYSPRGATVEETALLRGIVPRHVGVKAAGGIRTLEQLRALVAAGASRIGTSSTFEIASEWDREAAVRRPQVG